MRRVSATLLLAVFGVSLILPCLLADPESQLPACCRRLGMHHCSRQDSDSEHGTSIKAAPRRCASFPGTTAARSHVRNFWLGTGTSTSLPQLAHSARRIQGVSL